MQWSAIKRVLEQRPRYIIPADTRDKADERSAAGRVLTFPTISRRDLWSGIRKYPGRNGDVSRDASITMHFAFKVVCTFE